MNWSIKTRFALGVSAIFVMTLLTTLIVVLSSLEKRFEQTIGENITLLVSTHAKVLDNRLSAAKLALQAIAESVPMQSYLDPDIAQGYLEEQKSALTIFDLGLFIASADELLYGVFLTDPEAAKQRRGGKSTASETNFLAQQTRQVEISKPYASPACGGCPAIVMIMAVFDESDTFRGYLAGALKLNGDNLLSSLSDVQVGDNGYLYLVTTDRIMLMHPDQDRVMKIAAQPGANYLLDRALSDNYEGYGRTINSSGVDMLVAFHQVRHAGWILAANYPHDEAERPFKSALHGLYWMTALLGGILSIGVWLVSHRALTPLTTLSEHLTRLPRIKGSRQIQLKATGEAGQLVSSFNEMIAHIDAQQKKQAQVEAEIRNLNHNLELLVKQRTSELENSNQELEEAIDRLTAAQNELIEAEKLAALGSLVAGISHELNTPLGNCLLVSSTLEQQAAKLGDELQSGNMRRSSLEKHLNELIRVKTILSTNLDKATKLVHDFRQIATAQNHEIRRQFNLQDSIHHAVMLVESNCKARNCTIDLQLEPNIEMNSFPACLTKVITSVLENAATHAYDSEGGIVTISTMKQNSQVLITVCDQGRGISADTLPRVFEPFYSSRFGQGGSGLGMYVVFNLVTHVLGGKICVQSDNNQGCRVLINIPLDSPEMK
ncbi:sensor histidine kinase [Nitrincola alkalilacustris]|uniref:sensor histidine kinase n=1 Tax=Nitrincola alkalilacustris TaxID=1571224 RepID=UPI001456D9E4|nr:ATP-binding protein [Nitrincola alkalilacustris]